MITAIKQKTELYQSRQIVPQTVEEPHNSIIAGQRQAVQECTKYNAEKLQQKKDCEQRNAAKKMEMKTKNKKSIKTALNQAAKNPVQSENIDPALC